MVHRESTKGVNMENEFVIQYEQAVKDWNCIHAKEHGICEILSDNETKQYCILSPCPHYKSKKENNND